MSRTTVLVTLVIALVLGLGVVFTSPRDAGRVAGQGGLGTAGGNPAAGEGPALVFDPAKVRQIRVKAGSRDDILERHPVTGEWWIGVQGDPAKRWPVSVSSVRALLRMLSTLDGTPQSAGGQPAGQSAPLGESATLIALELDDGGRVQARLDTQPLGGRVILETTHDGEPRRVWVSSELHESLAASGVRAWRDPAAMPGTGPEVARISIARPSDAGTETIKLARVQGKWGVVEPIACPADEAAVGQLFATLGGLRVAEFLDERAPDPEAFKGPLLTIATEVDERSMEGETARTTTIARTLTIGSQAGLGEARLHARLETTRRSPNQRDDSNSAVFLVDPATLDRLPSEAAALVSKLALARPASEVASVAIQSGGVSAIRWNRGTSGWEEVRGPGTPTPMTPDDSVVLESVLKLLAEQPAERVMIAPKPKLTSPVTIVLESSAGVPLGTLTIGAMVGDNAPANQPAAVAIQDGQVLRVYGTATDAHGWLAASAASASGKDAKKPAQPEPKPGKK